MPLIRLDKMLADMGIGTRRELHDMIRGGMVRVGGVTARDPGLKVAPEKDRVFVGADEVVYKRYMYIMMNKPGGVVSASNDPRQRTVVDLLPPALMRPGLFPAGRLDKDTEGLLIITDDGPFAHRILSPKKHVEKRYFVRLDAPADEADAVAFGQGVVLEDGYECLPAKLTGAGTEVTVTLHEGKYHQIKRMFEARGKRVVFLKRLSMGGLALDGRLRPGEARELLPQEVALITAGT